MKIIKVILRKTSEENPWKKFKKKNMDGLVDGFLLKYAKKSLE